jgi:DNA-binding IclR family transcriptional regulator
MSDRYEIEAVSKALAVIESLEGIAFEPVTIATIIGRTGMSRDSVYRTLHTLRLRGYVIFRDGKWSIGPRIIRLAKQIARHSEAGIIKT